MKINKCTFGTIITDTDDNLNKGYGMIKDLSNKYPMADASIRRDPSAVLVTVQWQDGSTSDINPANIKPA